MKIQTLKIIEKVMFFICILSNLFGLYLFGWLGLVGVIILYFLIRRKKNEL